MTVEAFDWLPPASIVEVETAIACEVGDWLVRWLVDPPRVAVKQLSCSASGHSEQTPEAADTVSMGLAACAGRGDAQNVLDRDLLEAVGLEMVTDLLAFLAGPKSRALSGEAERFAIGSEQGRWNVEVVLGQQDLIALRKRAAGASRAVTLGSLGEALAGEQVLLGCHLGAATLTAAEVAAIGIGDLIVLDRQVAQELPLTVDGLTCASGAARISQLENTVAIHLVGAVDLRARVDDSDG